MNRTTLRSAMLLLAGAAMIFGGGCFFRSRPLFEYGPEGTPIQVKRRPRYPDKDLKFRYVRKAFRKHDGTLRASSPEQALILEEYGQPDYLRRPYWSVRGDRVHEWAYLEKNKIFQFVRQNLVYEGSLSDKDRILIQYGYPQIVLRQDDPLGSRRETFIYDSEWDPERRYYSFTDDKMVFAKETY